MVTDEQIKRLRLKIAEVRGWTDLEVRMGELWGHHPNWKGAHPLSNKLAVPNWPSDREASYGLIKDFTKLQDGLFCTGPSSAHDECVAYLESEGWRWVDCKMCATNTVRSTGIASSPIGDINPCPVCSGAKGEFKKENTHADIID